jgi:geranylgeranyl pyrophosphate synthase
MTDDGLAATETVLTEALDGVPGPLREPCRRVASAGGDRLPARLVLAVAGRAWPGTSRRTATAAASVELLHLALLVHDDLRDDAPVRRAVPTINAEEGTGFAVLAGDLLIGLSHRLAAAAGAGPLLGDALTAVCLGQALELEADNLRVAELRTGTMLATACLLGAIVTGTPEDGLREFGLAFGTAVHLLDDALALPKESAADVPATLRTVDDLVARAATARPELATLARRYRDSRLALLPRYPSVLSS